MRFAPDIEGQLTGAANAADRSNRPTLLVVAPALLLLGAIVLALVAHHRFSLAQSLLSDRLAERARVQQLIDYAADLEAAHPDVSDLFPTNVYMGVSIADVAKTIWDEEPTVDVGVKSNPRPVGMAREITRSDVDVSIQSPHPLDEIFEFIHKVMEDQDLKGRVFLARLAITPRPGGWMGSLRFRLYEKAN